MVHETKPLLIKDNNGSGSPNSSNGRSHASNSCSKWQSRFVLFLVILLVAALVGCYYSSNNVLAPISDRNKLPPAPLPLEEDMGTGDEEEAPLQPIMYRPFCLTHSKPTARILQTSMGVPSQQWSHIPCYAQTTEGRQWATRQVPNPHVNRFGAPDAIMNLTLDERPFVNRTAILGFGAAFTEAAALNYQSLSPAGKEALLELFFGKTGLGYSIGRVHINSCDFSVKSYSFDDTDGDFELKDFDNDVTHDQKVGMIEMILRATKLFNASWSSEDGVDGDFKMYASPWSPPAWMKQPTPSDKKNAVHAENMTGSTLPSCLREGTGPDSRYAASWALYFSKFITAYAKQGVPFWAVTVQNEPEFPAPWEACAYIPATEGEFIAYHLGPQLRKDHPDVQIFMFDHNKDHSVRWAKKLLNESHPASEYIGGTAIHWYAGGMDRLLDGAVGAPNMHRFVENLDKMSVPDNHIVIGSEACHCPSTGYAGGDIAVYWSRAERYAHTILSDLAAGSNGWVEWNLVLDSIGGPNHLGNLCDAAVLAVPHRAINGSDVPPTQEWEKAGNPFGKPIGDGRTRAELNAYGFPAKFLDAGLAVQPIYYYMGHISRYVRPGSQVVKGIVEESVGKHRIFRPQGQVVAGGGMNDLARVGVELTAWPCEGSTRQQFLFNEVQQLIVFGHDWLGKPTTSCVGSSNNIDFEGIVMTTCEKSFGSFEKRDRGNNTVSFEILNGSSPKSQCLVLKKLRNNGGAYGPRGGAQVALGSCNTKAALWQYDENTGEIISNFLDEGEVCMTTGWPFLQIGAFDTPNGVGDRTVVVLNEARDSANYILYDGTEPLVSGSIPPRSIQTVLINL